MNKKTYITPEIEEIELGIFHLLEGTIEGEGGNGKDPEEPIVDDPGGIDAKGFGGSFFNADEEF